MARKKMSDKEKKERLRERQRLWLRKKRSKLSEEMLEERRRKSREMYAKKKAAGLVKSIKDFKPRVQEEIRREWRKRSKKSREKKKQLKENERNVIDETPPSSPQSATPASSTTSRSVIGKHMALKNRRRLKTENLCLRERVATLEQRLARYRMRFLRKSKGSNRLSIEVEEAIVSKRKRKMSSLKEAVRKFLEEDDSSRLTSGKKETITKKKKKKQIRLLSDTMLNLYKKFKEDTGIRMSYALFCRHRPFWVLIPDARKRNTCLCLIHANMMFLVTSLRKAKIITANNPNEFVKTICCPGYLKFNCLMRKCELCKSKVFHFNDFNAQEKISCERWMTKKTPIVINNKTKLCQRTIKESFITTKSALIKTFEDKLPAYMKHVATIINQYKTVTKIKNTLTEKEALLHIDFAENYLCKYAEEVQSAHFGASKPQISLHTSVLYTKDQQDDFKQSIQSNCSVSQNLRHDPVLICAHLKPVIEFIKEKVPNIETLHIQSDGPTTQYKNKSMFFLIAKYIGAELGIDSIEWHFSESGHGKGAPDGIGACVKRTADAHVAAGHDISDYQKLISCLKSNCKGINILPIDDTHINNITQILEKSTTKPFKGTLTIRHLSWNKRNPDVIHARSFSCALCRGRDFICSHNIIGRIFLTYHMEDKPEENAILPETHGTPPSNYDMEDGPIYLPEICSSPSNNDMDDDSTYLPETRETSPSIEDHDQPSPVSMPPSPEVLPLSNKNFNKQDFYKMCYGSDKDEESDEEIFSYKRKENIRNFDSREKDIAVEDESDDSDSYFFVRPRRRSLN